jgi:predicted phage terminase large subunit-like protein
LIPGKRHEGYVVTLQVDLTPQEAASHLLARRSARISLKSYADLVMPGLVCSAHHDLVIQSLQEVERGEVDRLALFLPPGSAKSTWASVLFPAWFLGRQPDKSAMAVSHTAELAERFGRRVRNLVASREHGAIFGSGIAADSAAAGRWETERGGEYFAAGVGGSVTGRRADLVIIDDPVRSREDADSERMREAAWQWYLSDLLTRMKPGARQILVMTRWHEDDLGGRIMEREGHRWKVIKLPMIAGDADPLGRQPGERLWPEWFTDDMVETARQDVRSWNALYQQEPVPDDGAYFKAEWLGEYDSRPQNLRIYGASDYAVTDGGGDYTEHGVFGVDANSNIYVLDWWRGQTGPDVWIESLTDLILKWKPDCWFGEAGPIRRSVEPFLMRRLEERRAWCRIEWMASIADKTARARSIQARASMGKLWLPKHATWKGDVVGQMLKFPAGKHDDAVDVFSLIGRGLEYIADAIPQDDEPQISGGSWMG